MKCLDLAQPGRCGSIRHMRPIALVLVLLAGLNAPHASAGAPDRSALARARRAYNDGRYDAAIGAARHSIRVPDQVDASRLILARALLERYRAASDPRDLNEARDTLRTISLDRLPPAERYELMVGFGQWLFLTGRFGAAAELFDTALGSAETASPASRDRLLDWWASALDRQVQEAHGDARELYGQVLERMEQEARSDPSSAAAAYWIAAAARGLGRLDRAWQAAMAAWVRTGLTHDGAAALRSDLDRLVLTAIIPDRARERRAARGGQRLAADMMVTDWERFKADWEPSAPAPSLPPQ
jgi:tetratricopeptide (TPR) repeat protein